MQEFLIWFLAIQISAIQLWSKKILYHIHIQVWKIKCLNFDHPCSLKYLSTIGSVVLIWNKQTCTKTPKKTNKQTDMYKNIQKTYKKLNKKQTCSKTLKKPNKQTDMYENTQKTKQTNSHVQKQPKIKQTGMSKNSKKQTKWNILLLL